VNAVEDRIKEQIKKLAKPTDHVDSDLASSSSENEEEEYDDEDE
jgi:hypothetical protein